MITAQHSGGMFPCKKVAHEFAQKNHADVNKLHRDLCKDDELKKVCLNKPRKEVAFLLDCADVIGQNAGSDSWEPFWDCAP